ncbi:acyl carrier protein [Streptomyces sparsogenes]|uniref:Carrier domain-containing protein n=2 Tax=Streptomyces TaxID=1883 RepID=A0A1R1SRQ7_9ACTN|nr:phosphopantetheine-binding protein [Streptomyces sparsogenes]OMI40897.1 hypothetical protein SPAR_03526 [Streptomyces sparsogenes DSM 40356]
MDRESLVEEIARQITVVVPALAEAPPGPGTNLLEIPDFDSMAMLELLVWLQGNYGIDVPDGEVSPENLSTVGRIADFVLRQR